MLRSVAQTCPRCGGKRWDPYGGLCEVCDGVGFLYVGDARPARDEDAEGFFADYLELREEHQPQPRLRA
jgi:hypothetical protein